MLLRKLTETNDFPERSGQRLILAQRLGSCYRLKFIRYGTTKTYFRLYTLSPDEYTHLVTYYGTIISHTRKFSEHLITQQRYISNVYAVRLTNRYRMVAEYPNGYQHILEGVTIKQLHTLSKPTWETIDNGKRIAQFRLRKNTLCSQ